MVTRAAGVMGQDAWATCGSTTTHSSAVSKKLRPASMHASRMVNDSAAAQGQGGGVRRRIIVSNIFGQGARQQVPPACGPDPHPQGARSRGAGRPAVHPTFIVLFTHGHGAHAHNGHLRRQIYQSRARRLANGIACKTPDNMQGRCQGHPHWTLASYARRVQSMEQPPMAAPAGLSFPVDDVSWRWPCFQAVGGTDAMSVF